MVHLRITMDRMSISLSKPQLAYLRAEAKRLGISAGDLIRRIIDQHRAAPKSGPKNFSANDGSDR
jgi:hypothetical protein